MHSQLLVAKSTLQYKKNISQEFMSLVAWFPSFGPLKIKKASTVTLNSNFHQSEC
jgi:hypothetical protein